MEITIKLSVEESPEVIMGLISLICQLGEASADLAIHIEPPKRNKTTVPISSGSTVAGSHGPAHEG